MRQQVGDEFKVLRSRRLGGGFWGRAPAEIELGEFLMPKCEFWWDKIKLSIKKYWQYFIQITGMRLIKSSCQTFFCEQQRDQALEV